MKNTLLPRPSMEKDVLWILKGYFSKDFENAEAALSEYFRQRMFGEKNSEAPVSYRELNDGLIVPCLKTFIPKDNLFETFIQILSIPMPENDQGLAPNSTLDFDEMVYWKITSYLRSLNVRTKNKSTGEWEWIINMDPYFDENDDVVCVI